MKAFWIKALCESTKIVSERVIDELLAKHPPPYWAPGAHKHKKYELVSKQQYYFSSIRGGILVYFHIRVGSALVLSFGYIGPFVNTVISRALKNNYSACQFTLSVLSLHVPGCCAIRSAENPS